MSDYEHTWYNNPEWEFKYILTVARKPTFEEIDDISEYVSEVKEVKGDYDIVQEKDTLLYENAVFVNKEDGRTRFVLRDDLMDNNVELDSWYGSVSPEDVEVDKVRVDSTYYPFSDDVIPELEHRDLDGAIDRLKAFFRETPVKEIESESEFLNRLSVKNDRVLRSI